MLRRSDIVALAAFLLASASGCTPRESAPTAPVDELGEAARPIQESWRPRMDVSEGERPAFRLAAPYLARYDRGDSTFTHFGPAPDALADTGRVYLVLFGDTGAVSARVVANTLVYLDGERRFEAEGAVRVTTVRADGARALTTEILRWSEDDRRLLAPGFARLTTEDVSGEEYIEGYRLEADEALRDFTLENVTGRVRVEDE